MSSLPPVLRRELAVILGAFRAWMRREPGQLPPPTRLSPDMLQDQNVSPAEHTRLSEEALACRRCETLAARRRHVVVADGNPAADLMLVGEAPGEREDEQGRPFVGDAGQLLDKMFGAIAMDRSDLYITNIVKCHPPGNRDPEEDEISNCRPFLLHQIDLVRPLLICTLGRIAAQALLEQPVAITRIHGQLFQFQGIPLIPIYHPAFLLRSPERKKEAWHDLKFLKKTLDGLKHTLP